MKRTSVLVIDDDFADVEKIRAEFPASFDVVHVESYVKFIKAITHNDFDFAMIDYNLPGFNGSDCAAQLRAIGVPYFYYTGMDLPGGCNGDTVIVKGDTVTLQAHFQTVLGV